MSLVVAVSRPSATVELSGLTSDASVAIKDVVYSDGGVIKSAIASTVLLSGALGICVAKLSPTSATIVFAGRIEGLFTGLDDSKDYFLSPTVAGAITTTVPTAPGEIILRIGRAIGSTIFVVQIGSRLQRAP
jgi:hypothetical protein